MFFAQKTSKLIKDLEKGTTIRISKYLLQTISYNVAVSKFSVVELVFFFIYVIVIVDIFKHIMQYNNTSHSFNKFYQHTILFELILKWISEEGDFKLDYKWLFNKRNDENSGKIKETFKHHFGIEIDEIKTL